MHQATLCVHGDPDERCTGDGVNTPIEPSSAFAYLDRPEPVYPRYFNTPNQTAVTLALGAELLALSGLEPDRDAGRGQLQRSLDTGAAAEIFGRMTALLGGPADFVERMAANPALTDRQRRELRNGRRFEITTLHAGGQDKGHVYVVDDLPTDFLFPADSVKTELRLGETAFGQSVFVGLNPVHSADQMCLDIQSLINLYLRDCALHHKKLQLKWTS